MLPKGLPPDRGIAHSIDIIPNSKPPPHRTFRMAPPELKELKKQLDEYLSLGFIEHAKSPFGAGVLFAEKKNGKQRMCIDYRNLNNITIKDVYPLQLIDESIDNMAKSIIFSKLDLRSG